MLERENQILEILSETGKVLVSELADRLGVSRVTIRKDLDELERRKILRREHGYAVFVDQDDVNSRLAYNYSDKQHIARKALSLISPGETIMIENGSCCALLAEAIAKEMPNVTIITNSVFIANYVRGIRGQGVVLLGGEFQPEAQAVVGPIVRLCASQFYVKKLFVGVDGYISGIGFMGSNSLRVQAVRDMSDFADQVVVVTESHKFSKKGVVPFSISNKAFHVVTDSKIKEENENLLKNNNVVVHKAQI